MNNVLDLLSKRDIKRILKHIDLNEIKFSKYACITSKTAFLQNRFWLKDSKFGNVLTMDLSMPGSIKEEIPCDRPFGILPVIKNREIYKELNNRFQNRDVIELYEYPNGFINRKEFTKLNSLLSSGNLEKTGRVFNGHPEYYCDGHKYICCKPKFPIAFEGDYYVSKDETVWITVNPIKWINVRSLKMFVCANVLFTDEINLIAVYNGNFNETRMCKTLEQMYNEMSQKVPDVNFLLTDNELKNPLKFKFISYEEYIELSKKFTISISDYASSIFTTGVYTTGGIYESRNSWTKGYLPMVDYELIKNSCEIIEKNPDYLIVNFGEYPQHKLSDKMAKKIFESIRFDSHKFETGKVFTRVNHVLEEKDGCYSLIDSSIISKSKEYEVNNQKYIEMDNGEWFKVDKVKWVVDVKTGICTCLSVLFSGVNIVLNKDIHGSNLDRYIIKYFSKEIIPSKSKNIDKINEMISNDIMAKMIMNKKNINIDDLELNSEGKLILRRKQ